MRESYKAEQLSELKAYQAYIGGRFCGSSSKATLPMVSPSTGKVFATIPRCSAADIGRAVSCARATLGKPDWIGLSARQRGELLFSLANLLEQQAEHFALLEAEDTGKPIAQGRADIRSAIQYFRFYGGAADKVSGETLPVASDDMGCHLKGAPWRCCFYSSMELSHANICKSGWRGLAMGNAVIVKPSEKACLAILETAHLIEQAGFPLWCAQYCYRLGRGSWRSPLL